MLFSIFVSVLQGLMCCHRSGRTWSASIDRERTASTIPRRPGSRGYVRVRLAPTTWSRSSAKNAGVASPWRGTRIAMWTTSADTSPGFNAPTVDFAASRPRRFTLTSGKSIRKRRSSSSTWSSEHEERAHLSFHAWWSQTIQVNCASPPDSSSTAIFAHHRWRDGVFLNFVRHRHVIILDLEESQSFLLDSTVGNRI